MLKETPNHMIQVRGEWASDTTPGWRPAVAGPLNQTEKSDEEASTFSSLDAAEAMLGILKMEVGLPDEPAAGLPEFRITQRIKVEITPDEFSRDALGVIEETGIDPVEDFERLRDHRVTAEELLEECLNGAEGPYRERGWREYVHALAVLADR